MDDSVEWTENVHAWATKVQKALEQVRSENDPVKKYIKSVEYDRLLDEPAKYKLKMTEVFETPDGRLENVDTDMYGNKIVRDSNGDFVGYI